MATSRRVLRIAAMALLVSVAGAGCAPTHGATRTAGPAALAGESLETAVVIEAENEIEGVQREYQYVRDHYPGWEVVQQLLIHRDKRSYDQLDIEAPDGTRKTLYFDISGWFGKL